MLAFALVAIAGLKAQDLDEMLRGRSSVDCSEIAFNSSIYFIKYMQEGKADSARIILDYWEAKCGLREPVFRARTLYALSCGEFGDHLLGDTPLWHIANYNDRLAIIHAGNPYRYDHDKAYFGYIPPGSEFDEYTLWLAGELTRKYEPGSVEYLLAEFYSERGEIDDFYTKLQSNEYANTLLARGYHERVADFIALPEWHWAFIGGIWAPVGELSDLGVHPDLGWQFGVKSKRMNYDLTIMLKFSKAANTYLAKREGEWLETDHFFGGYFGFDVGYDI